MPARTAKPRSARARGLRTLQHQTLPVAIYYAIDTEVWLRTLIVATSQPARDPRWATKDQVHDEAVAWFLEHCAEHPPQPRAARRASDEDLTFWIDSKLIDRARRLARQQGIRLAQLIETALSAYVQAHVPEEFGAFRRRVQQEAGSLYGLRARASAPAAEPKALSGPPRSQRGRLR